MAFDAQSKRVPFLSTEGFVSFAPLLSASAWSHTGTVNETFMYSSGINLVGLLNAGDVVPFNFGIQATNSANNKTFRGYVSDSPSSLVNPVLIYTVIQTTGIINTAEAVKYFNVVSLISQNVVLGTATGVATGTSMGIIAVNLTGATGPKYFVETAQLANAGEIMKRQYVRSQINRY